MRQARNRGAGLVTVVVVLAVSGILLSGALWLAVTHYKSAVRAENTVSARAELALCAELVQMTLENSAVDTLSALLDETSPTPLQRFYGGTVSDGGSPVVCKWNEAEGLLTIQMENGSLQLSGENVRECLTITFFSLDGQALASASYAFDGGEIQIVDPDAAEMEAAP